mmetsp:Transcript_19972/g.65055  ORF Transcript_19972/g.65055 Transcript_19972/m.65055 type:complete len:207 (+) Transcript_19972:1044-1664(+)
MPSSASSACSTTCTRGTTRSAARRRHVRTAPNAEETSISVTGRVCGKTHRLGTSAPAATTPRATRTSRADRATCTASGASSTASFRATTPRPRAGRARRAPAKRRAAGTSFTAPPTRAGRGSTSHRATSRTPRTYLKSCRTSTDSRPGVTTPPALRSSPAGTADTTASTGFAIPSTKATFRSRRTSRAIIDTLVPSAAGASATTCT